MTNQPATPIAVIGAGSWGTALALLLARNHQVVRLWGREIEEMRVMQTQRINQHYLPGFVLPELIEVHTNLESTLKNVRDILIVVPSHAFREILKTIKPLLHSEFRLAWGTKGLDAKNSETLDKVVEEELGAGISVAALSGPSLASEVAKGLPTAVTLASNDDLFADQLIQRFYTESFRIYKSSDMIGVELCGVVKNVLAIGAGICDGLQLGNNARSAFITRGIAELSRLLNATGGQTATLMSLAGIGDIILTCTSPLSRNYRFGLAVGKGKKIDAVIQEIGQVVEGYANTDQLKRLSQRHAVEMPIVSAIYNILHLGLTPKQAAQELLSRDGMAKWE
jgi:glycerol-3-phosphate dehydrogenase (NAD(P)+)